MTAALKDNVLVAGVPMMNGSSFMDGYVPELDATVVTRLLDAGAEITGKLHCEYFCLSGSSHTNATGACQATLETWPFGWRLIVGQRRGGRGGRGRFRHRR